MLPQDVNKLVAIASLYEFPQNYTLIKLATTFMLLAVYTAKNEQSVLA